LGILQVHTKNIPLSEDVDLETIARGTPGFVGADLANLVNEAALLAARFGQQKVTMLDFEEATDKVYMGTERKSLVLSAEEKRSTAFHEAGHAICNIHAEHGDPLHKVTIIPRGRALGVTWSLPKEDKYSQTKDYLLDKVCMSMGGRAAEELVFDQRTTGASQDITQATRLVRRLVCEFGMTDELGPIAYGEKNEQIFLGRDFNQHRDYSEKTAQEIDALVRRIIEEQYARAKKILTDNRDELDRLAEALIEHELLDFDEVTRVIGGEQLTQVKKTRSLPKRAATEKQSDLNNSQPDSAEQPQQAQGEESAATPDQNSTSSGEDQQDTKEQD
jgi:cell division protease FtsH